ncbi:hypothetical protein ACH0BF_16735 [Pseudobacillus sp. 179-B 2D1 NHS]|uniref:hypothetical protein n=1 Tax=Pseudobacillus sp. 179-B 2D1 NHS TaxID=3374292 RepID=UPI003879F9E5
MKKVQSRLKMKVILATGNPKINSSLMKHLDCVTKVEYLEQLLEVEAFQEGVNVVILSAYIPSTYQGQREEKKESFIEVINFLIENNVRIIYLADLTSSEEALNYLFNCHVYDYVISMDGNMHLKEIMELVNAPTGRETASQKLKEFKKVKAGQAIEGSRFNNTVPSAMKPRGRGAGLSNGPMPLTSKAPAFGKKSPNQLKTQSANVKKDQTIFSENKQSVFPGKRTRVEEQKVQAQVKGTEKVFAFWGQTQNVGKRTLSQSFAHQLAEMNYKVLYVELDYLSPAFATTTGLSSSVKNFYQLCLSQDNFELENYIASKLDAEMRGRGFQKVLDHISGNLHFLTLPINFKTDLFPAVTDRFLPLFMETLKSLEYDAIILNLPNQLENVFTFPVMLEVDVIFNVLTDSIVRINEYRELKSFLKVTSLEMERWNTIFNFVGEGVSKEALDNLISETSATAVPMDPHRSLYEMDLQFGSPVINEYMRELASDYGFEGHRENSKKKKFGLF